MKSTRAGVAMNLIPEDNRVLMIIYPCFHKLNLLITCLITLRPSKRDSKGSLLSQA